MANLNQSSDRTGEVSQLEQGTKASMLKVLRGMIVAALVSVPAIAEAGARTDLDCKKAEKILTLNNNRNDLVAWKNNVCNCAPDGRLGRIVGSPRKTQTDYNNECGRISMTPPAAGPAAVVKPAPVVTPIMDSQKPTAPIVKPPKPPKKQAAPVAPVAPMAPVAPVVASAPDAGTTADAGTQLDAGVAIDAGTTADAGTQLDGGTNGAPNGGAQEQPKSPEGSSGYGKYIFSFLALLSFLGEEGLFRVSNRVLKKKITKMANKDEAAGIEKVAKDVGVNYEKPKAEEFGLAGYIPFYGSIYAWSCNKEVYEETKEQREKIVNKLP